MEQFYQKGSFSKVYAQLPTVHPGLEWREGMVSGNGENGFITSGAPYQDSMIFQNMWFNFPSDHPRFVPPELPGQLEEARQAVFRLDDEWAIKQVHPDGSVTKRIRTFYYSFHPGAQLRLCMNEPAQVHDYCRWTNYEIAEVGVCYTDERGTWVRTSFTSRADDVSVTKITRSSAGAPIGMTLSIDDILSMHKAEDGATKVSQMQYKKLVPQDGGYLAQVAHYPAYEGSELQEGGYATVTKIVAVGGSVRREQLPDSQESINVGAVQNPAVVIQDAEEVYLLTKSARTFSMGRLEAFEAAEGYALTDALLNDLDAVAAKYRTASGGFDYPTALACHQALHQPEFRAVCLNLDDDAPRQANEELLEQQRQTPGQAVPALLQQIYEQARYAQICCSGSSGPRLCGMWTGEWQPGWRGIYTLDANVNLQVAPINTGHMTYAPLGYLTFVLRNAPDWMLNAKMSYGMEQALQVSVNSDIDRGMHVEYDNDYPFQYWNAGASWCLLPLYEYWQCNGNQRIPLDARMRPEELRHVLNCSAAPLTAVEMDAIQARGWLDLESEILLPLLTKQANFWKGLCTPEYYTDRNGKACYQKGKSVLEEGERYLLIPGYSPENHPIGYSSTLTANATMDISAARDGLHMVVELEKAVKADGFEARIAAWEALAGLLPSYQTDESGALREWAMNEYEENNNHRHASHLYAAWPAYETRGNQELTAAAVQAMENRNRYNVDDATAGHSWMHKALVEARLGQGDRAVNALLQMMANQGYYTSLMTDHDTNRRCGCYCTDTLFASAAVLQELLVYSNSGEIELLPALPQGIGSGSVKGLLTRTQVEIVELCWDLQGGIVRVTLQSPKEQTVCLRLGVAQGEWVEQETRAEVCGGEALTVKLLADHLVTLTFEQKQNVHGPSLVASSASN